MVSVILIIKTPSLKLSDLTYCCDSASSVYQLKTYLQNQYPSKPKPEEQRLIYQGKLLRDDEIFQDFLRDLDKEQMHTLHLVYALKRAPSLEIHESSTTSLEGSSNDDLRLQHDANSNSGVVPGSSEVHDWNAIHNFYSGYESNLPGADHMTHQLLWWQQNYQHYWSLYMQQLNSGQQAVTPTPHVPPTAPAPTAPAPVNLEPPQQEGPRAPQLAAVGGVAQEDDEEGVQVARDWLDWMYVGSRFAILLGVMYYYSSLPRFMLVTLIVAGIYLYQKAVHQRRRNALLRNGELNNRAEELIVPQPAADGADHVAPIDEPAIPNGDRTPHAEENNINQGAITPNGLNVALNLLVGFFTSLIPEVPAPNALN